MKKITLFSDGSCLGNPGPGGYCAILKYKESEKVIKGGEALTTNNRMELQAVIEALKNLKESCEIELYSDSKYVIDAIKSWLGDWVKKDFKNVKNVDLWREFLEVKKGHTIHPYWVKGHSDNEYNNKCDEIAREEAQKFLAQKG